MFFITDFLYRMFLILREVGGAKDKGLMSLLTVKSFCRRYVVFGSSHDVNIYRPLDQI